MKFVMVKSFLCMVWRKKMVLWLKLEIDEYWDKMLKGKNRGKKLKNIKVKRIIFYGKVIYLILEGKI